MGGAILLGTCLSGLQGLRGPLGLVPAEAAGNNNVVSKAAGVDIAYRAARNTLPCPHGTSWGHHIRPTNTWEQLHREKCFTKKSMEPALAQISLKLTV